MSLAYAPSLWGNTTPRVHFPRGKGAEVKGERSESKASLDWSNCPVSSLRRGGCYAALNSRRRIGFHVPNILASQPFLALVVVTFSLALGSGCAVFWVNCFTVPACSSMTLSILSRSALRSLIVSSSCCRSRMRSSLNISISFCKPLGLLWVSNRKFSVSDLLVGGYTLNNSAGSIV